MMMKGRQEISAVLFSVIKFQKTLANYCRMWYNVFDDIPQKGDYYMSSAKKKRTSVFSVLVVIVLLLTIALTVIANVIFSDNITSPVAGYYLYLHEESDMLPDVPQNTLVVARSSDYVSLSAGNKVLCHLANGSVALRLIYLINLNEDNSTSYFVGTVEEQGSEPAIPKNNIFAVCTWASPHLYQYVKFATSVNGLLALLVVPCVILIIMLLVKIVASNREEPEQNVEFEDDSLLFEDPGPSRRPKKKEPKDPLFTPEQIAQNDESLEQKKSSIQENFSAKPVNEDSPYQRAVQERTTKFRVPDETDIEQAKKEETERKRKAVTPPDFGANVPQDSPVQYIQKEPPAQPVRSQPFQPQPLSQPYQPLQQQGAPMQQPVIVPQPPVQQPIPPQGMPVPQSVPPVPVVDISKVQPVQNTVQTPEEIRLAALERETARVKESRKESSPNIDDILMASQMRKEIRSSASKTSNSEIARTDSIDDLIAVLEKKKNNL